MINEKNICIFLFIFGLLGFILHIFVFEKPDGNLGMILCMIEAGCICGSTVRLCQISKEFKDGLFRFLGIFFRF